MNITAHRLSGSDVSFRQSPNHSGKFANNLPDTLVMHYTAGASLAGSVSWLCNPDAKASAHIVIGRGGSIVQLVPFDTIAWHAGVSTWKGRSSLNSYSIGIELDNAGVLTKVGDEYRTSFNAIVPPAQVIEGTNRNESKSRFWQSYTDVQVQKARELCALLIATYGIKEIVGHEEISPGRKTDPGPAFPLDKFREGLLSKTVASTSPTSGPVKSPLKDTPKEDQPPTPKASPQNMGTVSANSGLNIRSGAGGSFDSIADPLPKGQAVKILEEKNGWFRVETTIEGWVKSDYINKTTK